MICSTTRHYNISSSTPRCEPLPSDKPLLAAFADLRPRSHRPSSAISTLLPSHENIYTLPNILTFSRLLCAPVVGYLISHDLYVPALGLFVYAGVTDLVDGWVARKWGLQTVVGTVIDPMADKALMTVVTICLALKGALPGMICSPLFRGSPPLAGIPCQLFTLLSSPPLPKSPPKLIPTAPPPKVPLTILILGRDLLLALTALYIRYRTLPAPRTFARYWDFSLPSAEVHPTQISKINTFLQLGVIGATMSSLAMGGLGEAGQTALEAGWWVVGGTTVWSGGSYLVGGKGFGKVIARARK